MVNQQAGQKLFSAKSMLRNAIVQASVNPIATHGDLLGEIDAALELLFEAAVLEATTIAEHRVVFS